jgi:putative transposase
MQLMTAMGCVASCESAGLSQSSRTTQNHHPFDEVAYRQRNLIERMFCRLKDWRRIATRYDKLAANFAAAIMLAAVVIWWT